MSRISEARFRKGCLSLDVKKKSMLALAGLLALLGLIVLLGICSGSSFISPMDAIRALSGNGSAQHAMILETLRLPRALTAVLVGAALGAAGAIVQGIIRNPLGSPDTMGITAGAAFAAVVFITYFSGKVSIHWLPAAAFAGAGLISLLIYTLAWKRGITPIRLVLIGIGISAAGSSATMLMLVIGPSYTASQAYVWLTGSIYGATWTQVTTLLPWAAVLIPCALLYVRFLNVQQLGDETAKSLGFSVQRDRFILIVISVGLAGSAVAIGGAIGFIGLLAPHMARKLMGYSYGAVISASAVIGALIMVGADTLARTAFLPLDVPAGVFTAGVGAPFFIYLLYRNRNA
ncbi:iron ABC transporter permease [Paenibacillus turpanensis]|uniref:FecCD family ABC transporter permease n=1 Tax=Paenibacillus turpanensis TaxID=2689078 RepID=UPI0031332279